MLVSLDLYEYYVERFDASIEQARLRAKPVSIIPKGFPEEWLSTKGLEAKEAFDEELETLKNKRSRSGILNMLLTIAFNDPAIMKSVEEDIEVPVAQ